MSNTMTFWELITKYKITIPMIQRDYAQGRKENENLCKEFLKSLSETLVSDEYRILNLDFVYGSLESSSEPVFLPLDGQQRLTTLFLIHWYIANREGIIDSAISGILERFTYRTRQSSTRFCIAISNSALEFEDSEIPSEVIKDESWFIEGWNADPTVNAMLNTLDLIHENEDFRNSKDLWIRLTSEGRITFNFLLLEDYGLTDDLYIRMNARGKLLTPFENFKADLVDKASHNGWDDNGHFSTMIQTSWTDFLWERCIDNADVAVKVDQTYMNFVSAVLMIAFALSENPEASFLIRQLNKGILDLHKLMESIGEEEFKLLYDYSELYLNIRLEHTNPSLNFWNHEYKSLIEYVFDGKCSFSKMALFYGESTYILDKIKTEDIDVILSSSGYEDWMRFVRNFVAEGHSLLPADRRRDLIESEDEFTRLLKLLHKIHIGMNGSSIVDYLKNLQMEQGERTPFKARINGEIQKAKLISVDHSACDIIHDLEENALLRGNIDIAFKYSTVNGVIDIGKLSECRDLFDKYFSWEEDDVITFDMFRRALMSIGESPAYEYWWSGWNVYYDKEGWWRKRRLILTFTELEGFIKSDKWADSHFIPLLHELNASGADNPIDAFRYVIDNADMSSYDDCWREMLVKNDEIWNLWEESDSKRYVAFSNKEYLPYRICLLHGIKPQLKNDIVVTFDNQNLTVEDHRYCVE